MWSCPAVATRCASHPKQVSNRKQRSLPRLLSQCPVQHCALPTKAWSCWRCCEVFPSPSAVFTSSDSCSSIGGLLETQYGSCQYCIWYALGSLLRRSFFPTRRVMVTPAMSRRWRTAALAFSGGGFRSLWLVPTCSVEDFKGETKKQTLRCSFRRVAWIFFSARISGAMAHSSQLRPGVREFRSPHGVSDTQRGSAFMWQLVPADR